jgi:hypothetical protein
MNMRSTAGPRKRIWRIAVLGAGLAVSSPWEFAARGQTAPAASGARILLLPRQIVSGERATLAVLDVNERLTPERL